MSNRLGWLTLSLSVGAAALIAIPVVGQDRPESILPPGFGDAPATPPRRADPEPVTAKPAPAAPSPTLAAGAAPAEAVDADPATARDENAPTSIAELIDLPPQARRPTNRVGLLSARDGDMGPAAFSGVNGPYLTKLMRHIDAPLASRWASIVLRRALLSRAQTPANVSDADWAAERAWLLVRMGEATSARDLVQAVDIDRYTPALYAFGMQAALASADPAALCPMVNGVDRGNRDTSWTLARAICSAFSGDNSLSTAQLDRARSRRGDNSPDVLLAEKVVGAAQDTRRAVTINWDDIQRLDVWRYGMATATGLAIPDRLIQSVDGRVRLWRAQAPMLPYTARLTDAERAAASGIFSIAALVDFYAAAFAEQDPADQGNRLFDLLRDSYAASDDDGRVSAMSRFWSQDLLGEWQGYARYVATARAAARIAPSDDLADQAAPLMVSMFSAGLDRYALRWAPMAQDDVSWGLLAVGSPRPQGGVTQARIADFGAASSGDGDLRAQMLFAGLAALGRIPVGDVASMAENFDVPLTKQTKWSAALDTAVRLRSPGAVAVLCAVGLQANRWSDIPPDHLFRIVSALRRVGLEPEARMIAVEAISRA